MLLGPVTASFLGQEDGEVCDAHCAHYASYPRSSEDLSAFSIETTSNKLRYEREIMERQLEVKDWVLNFLIKGRFHWVLHGVVWRQEVGKEATPTSVVHSILPPS